MEEAMPGWAREFMGHSERLAREFMGKIDERLGRLESKQKDATKLKPVQENDGVATHKSDEGETESKPIDLEDPDEVKSNEVEAVKLDQSEQNCDEVFKLSTDKIDDENVSELAINGEGFKKDAIIVPHCSLSPSTTITSHASALSPPLLAFAPNPLCSPPHHSLPHQHRYYQSDPPPPLIAQPDLSTASHCCRSVLPFFLHLDLFIISASDEKCQRYLICWKGRPSSDDSWNSRDDLRWLDPDLLERYQSGLIQDPTESTPFDPGGFLMITLQENCRQPSDHRSAAIAACYSTIATAYRRSPFLQLDGVEFLSPREN